MDDKPLGNFTTSTNPQKNTVRLELNDQFIQMSTSQFERLIEHLGQVRATLQPPVPANPDPRRRELPLLQDFVVATADDQPAIECGARFFFRSLLFGWQAIALTPECCQMLGEDLLGIASRPLSVIPDNTNLH